jgi:hypothetical protein
VKSSVAKCNEVLQTSAASVPNNADNHQIKGVSFYTDVAD